MSDLNKMAVAVAEELRGRVLGELVELDVRTSLKNQEYSELKAKAHQANEDATLLFTMRKNKDTLLRALDSDIRELKRPREGFPHLDDEEYEMRMEDLRTMIQEAVSL